MKVTNTNIKNSCRLIQDTLVLWSFMKTHSGAGDVEKICKLILLATQYNMNEVMQ